MRMINYKHQKNYRFAGELVICGNSVRVGKEKKSGHTQVALRFIFSTQPV